MYDYLIIGAGISGIGAAQSISLQNKNFLILEKNNTIGGHQNTMNITDNCHVDTAFIYGHNTYYNLLKIIKLNNLELGHHDITFSAGDSDNNIKFNNTNTIYLNNEIERFIKIGSKLPFWWWLITLKQFLNIYKFSSDFSTYVIKPALSIFFVTNNSYNKPAYVVVKMILGHWITLSPLYEKPKLWYVKEGNQKIIENIIKNYNLQNNIKTNSGVISVEKKNNFYIIKTTKNIYKSRKIIFSVEPNIIKKIFINPTYMQNFIINWGCNNTEPCYGILHNYTNEIPPNINTKYYFKNYENTWKLTGQLDCNVYKTISPTKITSIPSSNIIKEYYYVHPKQNILVMILVASLFTQLAETDSFYLCGTWTTILSHEEAYLSGLKTGDRALNSYNYNILFRVLICFYTFINLIIKLII